MRTSDHYLTLGVHPDDSQEEIKAAFRNLSNKYHPDKNPDSTKEANERIKKVNEAYSVLSDPEQRREYDRMRSVEATDQSSYARHDGSTFTGTADYEEDGEVDEDCYEEDWGDDRPWKGSFASPGRQLAARLLDLIIVGAVVLTARVLGVDADAAEKILFLGDYGWYLDDATKMFLWAVLVGFAYETFLVGLRGRTLGMMAARVKVVRADGGYPGWWKAGMRMSLALALPGMLAVVTLTGDLRSSAIMVLLSATALRFFLKRRMSLALALPGMLAVVTLDTLAGGGLRSSAIMVLLGATALRFFLKRRGLLPGGLSRVAQVFGAGLIVFPPLQLFVALVYILSPFVNQNGRAFHDELADVVIVKA